MSFGMMVTRLAWMAHKLVSSKRPTRYASDASWSANTAVLWNAQIRLEVLRDFAHETLERELADQEFRRLLVLAASSKRAIHHSLVSHSSFVLGRQQISLI